MVGRNYELVSSSNRFPFFLPRLITSSSPPRKNALTRQDAKADVILRYSPDEARSLKAYGELPESAKINETNFDEECEDDIDFAEMSEEEDAIDDI